MSSSTLLLCNWRWQVKVRSRVEAVGNDGHFSDAIVEFALDKSGRRRRGDSVAVCCGLVAGRPASGYAFT